jgi:hypothetical protein
MFKDVRIVEALSRERKKIRRREDILIEEVNRILNDELYTEKNILKNLKSYNQTFDLLDESLLDKNRIYGIREIKNICIQYNMRFLDSQLYKGEFPSEAITAIKELSKEQKRQFRNFKILGSLESFRQKSATTDPMLFAETNYGNYFLIHHWDNKVAWHAKLVQFPMRRFENLIACLALLSAVIALIIPNRLIVTSSYFGYWGTHRVACFIHILIWFAALTVFLIFSFHKNFSSSTWDEAK